MSITVRGSGHDASRPDRDTADVDADARALASTLRLRILRLCLDDSLTNREIAERLDRNPATVLHHVRTLVDRGFLVAEPARRGNRGSREVPYRATGKSWRTPGGAGMSRILIDTFLEEVALVDPQDVVTTRLGLRLDARRAARSWPPGSARCSTTSPPAHPHPTARRTPCSSPCTRT